MKKSIFNASLLAILVIGGIVASFLYNNMTKRPEYSTLTVPTGNITYTLSIDGSIKPEDSADLGFEIGGTIAKLPFAVGDSVPAGAVLAYANATDLQAQYQQSQDLAASAQSELNQDRALVDKANEQLASLEHNHASSEDRDAQRADINSARSQVSAQKHNVAAAQAGAAAAKFQLDKKIITAPFAGIISHQDVKVGEVAQSNVPIITLMSGDSFKVEAYVSELDVNNFKVGDSANVALDTAPGQPYAAKITAIDPAESNINNVASYKITLNFSDQISDLRSGTGVNVSVVSQSKQNVVIIPQNAVFTNNGKNYVYASENGLRVSKEIQTGLTGNDGMVEIVSGLSAGDTIFELNK